MTVLGAPGDVFLLTHSVLRSQIGLPTTARVERIDPITLRTLARSPRLQGGPMWPGGMAVVPAKGSSCAALVVVYGRYAHRLDRDCQPLAQCKLPIHAPYNSFVLLENGLLVTKNLSDTTPAWLSVLDPETLGTVGPAIACPEPSIARLSAVGNTVYVVGVRSIMRFHWNAALSQLVMDSHWRYDYSHGNQQSYGWDVVLDGTDAWFMDNGKHRYRHKMVGAGVAPSANRLLRVSLTDASDHSAIEVSGMPYGSITNPPLVDGARRIVIAFDSANKHLRAWRISGDARTLEPLWHLHSFGAASHMIVFTETGELVVNDYQRWGEEVVVLDIETGQERGRVRVGGIYQGVVFPSVGWSRDLYWSSMGKLSRIYITERGPAK